MPSRRKSREGPVVSAGGIGRGCYRAEGSCRPGGEVTIAPCRTTVPRRRRRPERPEDFVAKDRAKRLAFRLGAIGKERAATFLGGASG